MNQRKIFWISIAVAVGYFGYMIFINFYLPEIVQASPFSNVLLTVTPGLFLYFFLNRLYQKHEFLPLWVLPPASGHPRKYLLLAGVAVPIVVVVLVGLLIQLIYFPLDKVDQHGIMLLNFVFDKPFSTLVSMLSPAIAEELTMRAGVLHAIWAIGKKKLAISLNSIVFGIMHIFNLILNDLPFNAENIIWLFSLMIAGLLLSFVYVRFGLLSVIFLHWLWNASFAGNLGIVEKNIVGVIAIVVIIITVEWFYRYTQKAISNPVALENNS